MVKCMLNMKISRFPEEAEQFNGTDTAQFLHDSGFQECHQTQVTTQLPDQLDDHLQESGCFSDLCSSTLDIQEKDCHSSKWSCVKCNKGYLSEKKLNNHKCPYCTNCAVVFSSNQKFQQHKCKPKNNSNRQEKEADDRTKIKAPKRKQSLWYQQLSRDAKQSFLAAKRSKYQNQTPEERRAYLEQVQLRDRERYPTLTLEEKREYLEQVRPKARERYQTQTPEEREAYLEQVRPKARERYQTQTPEERRAYLEKVQLRDRERYPTLTPGEKREYLEQVWLSFAKKQITRHPA